MSIPYKVTFNINEKYGYIAYDEVTKSTQVIFADPKLAKEIEAWLKQEHLINTPNDTEEISDFSYKTYCALKSKNDFQVVLTRIFEQLGVHVDWSFPQEYI